MMLATHFHTVYFLHAEPDKHKRRNTGGVHIIYHMATFSTHLMFTLKISDNVRWNGDAHERNDITCCSWLKL